MSKGFSQLAAGAVLSEWVDRNGHMNVVYYMRIFDEGTFRLVDLIGFSDGAERGDRLTLVAGRINIVHRKELVCGEPWQLETGVVDVSPSHLTLMHRLTSKGRVRAQCYIRGSVFCMDRRTTGVLEPLAIAKAREFIVPGLRDPFAL